MLKSLLLRTNANYDATQQAGHHMGYLIGSNIHFIIGGLLLIVLLLYVRSRRKRNAQ